MEMNTPSQNAGPPGGSRVLRHLFSTRLLGRFLFAAACAATLLGVLYAVENWRGRQAWEKCRRDLETKGAKLNWDAFVPAPVPDT